jgi:hypothetical protein
LESDEKEKYMKRTKNEAVDRMVAIMRECNNVALFDDERAELAEHLMKHDVVELVRCEKCAYSETFNCPITGEGRLYCRYWQRVVEVAGKHYCGYGERKEQ